ncbi:acyl-CoA thioesterase domain-containing protein [Nocardioides sp. cx-173]|uniref:PaaI family thioesterase n=1 Tax=Nocardioides sp. cx-173 TaxID=2898796 RepID=UPI001E4F3379|nr:acyl-CoA thioesterase domain-containing protein [Nocardioides sp. cx-173]MCD4526630.1 hypothetical protein [Nocardioides sp. cx-173]UGB40723.1 hypothetical protein LQ940_15230 [Nocardioides sp. cx-173]
MEPHPAALGAVARTRALGLHFWGQFVGVTPLDHTPGHTRMRLVPESTVLSRDTRLDLPVEVTSLVTLADLSLGFAIRAQGSRHQRLATTSLSLQLVARPRGAVTCRSEVVWTSADATRALVHAHLTDAADGPVAEAQAWFLTLPIPPDAEVTAMPWERRPSAVPRLSAADLTPEESAAVTAATIAAQRANALGSPVARELLGLEWSETSAERVVGAVEVGPHLANRIGDVQGGALFGIAATAAERLMGEGLELADAGMQYLRPVRGSRLSVTATAVRRGRSAGFVEARIDVDGQTTNVAHLTFLATTR